MLSLTNITKSLSTRIYLPIIEVGYCTKSFQQGTPRTCSHLWVQWDPQGLSWTYNSCHEWPERFLGIITGNLHTIVITTELSALIWDPAQVFREFEHHIQTGHNIDICFYLSFVRSVETYPRETTQKKV